MKSKTNSAETKHNLPALQLLLSEKSLTLAHTEEERLDSFFIKFNKLVRELKGSDAKLSENEIIICFGYAKIV